MAVIAFLWLVAVQWQPSVAQLRPRAQPTPAQPAKVRRSLAQDITLVAPVSQSTRPSLDAPSRLADDGSVTRELRGGETHAYDITLRRGEFLRVEIEQHGVDVVATLRSESGAELVAVDLRRRFGREPMSYEAVEEGNYRLEVRPTATTAPAGRYELTWVVSTGATARQREQLAAELLLAEVIALWRSDEEEKLREGIAKGERSVAQWRRLGDKYWLAHAYNSLGGIYFELGEWSKALVCFDQALLLRRLAGDRPGEAITLSNISHVYKKRDERQRALGYYTQALPLYKAVGDRYGEADTLSSIGHTYGGLRRRQSALDYFGQALALYRSVGERGGEAEVLGWIALLHSEFGESRKALDYYHEALPLVRAAGNRVDEAYTLIKIGQLYATLGQREMALDSYDKALRIFKAGGSREGEADALTEIGRIYRARGERQQAFDHFGRALSIYETIADPFDEANASRDAARLYRLEGEQSKALAHYLRSLRLYREAGERVSEADMFCEVGDTYLRLREGKKALDSYTQALALYRERRNRNGQAEAVNGVGYAYDALGERQKALGSYRQALSLFKAVGNRQGQAVALENMGLVYDATGEKRKALLCFTQALPLYKTVRDPDQEADLLLNTGNIYFDLGDRRKALRLYERGLALYRSASNQHGEALAHDSLARTYGRLGQPREALSHYERHLSLRDQIGWREGRADVLADIARAHDELGDASKALQHYQHALQLYRDGGDRRAEADVLDSIAHIHVYLNRPRESLAHFEQVLALRRATSDREGEADALSEIADTHAELEEYGKALASYRQALALWREQNDRGAELQMMRRIGAMHLFMGDKSQASESFRRILQRLRADGDRGGEAETLCALGFVHHLMGERQKAWEYYGESLALLRYPEVRARASLLQFDMPNLFVVSEDYEGLLRYYRRAYEVSRAYGDRRLMAASLTHIGRLYSLRDDEAKALESFRQALSLYREAGRRAGMAAVLNELGNVYLTRPVLDEARSLATTPRPTDVSSGSGLARVQADTIVSRLQAVVRKTRQTKRTALRHFGQALVLNRAAQNRSGEAKTLVNMCIAHHIMDENQQALDLCRRVLRLAREVSDAGTEFAALYRLMRLWEELSSPQLAIIYGKQAVNLLQSTRSLMRKLDKGLEKSYARLVTDAYRELAALLIKEGRLPEAEQVLAMLKEEEFFRHVRGDDSVAAELRKRSDLSSAERDALERYDKIADRIIALGRERDHLEGAWGRLPSQSEQARAIKARLDAVREELAVARKAMDVLVRELKEKLGKGEVRVDVVNIEAASLAVSRVKEPRTVLVQTIVHKDGLYMILSNSKRDPRPFIVGKIGSEKFSEERLNALIGEFREAATDPTIDPRPAGQKLYDLLIKPLEADLQSAEADTIVWSLDASLRYVPVAALYDARHGYLAERYANVVITLNSLSGLEHKSADKGNWQALGIGVSKAVAGFSELPNVPEELRAIIREPDEETGLLGGRRLLNEQLTLDAFDQHLSLDKYKVIHAATHFSFIPGTRGGARQSFLLLGDGGKLTLEQVHKRDVTFDDVELLVLSACNTEVGGRGSDGSEVEGFGMLAQQEGARSVIATLWHVADSSTRELMVRFYQLHLGAPDVNKAQALRRAQLALLNGGQRPEGARPRAELVGREQGKSLKSLFSTDPRKPYAHPYYWAPFILIGNWG